MHVQTFSLLPLSALAAASGLFAYAFQGMRLQNAEALAGALVLTTLATLFYWIKPCPGEASRRHCLLGWICCKLKRQFRCGCSCNCRECYHSGRSRPGSAPCTPCQNPPSAPGSVTKESLKKEIVRPSSVSLQDANFQTDAPATPSSPFLTAASVLSACPSELSLEEPPKPVRGGAVLLVRRVPEVEILHLRPNNWCVSTSVAEDDDQKIREAAEAKIFAATGLKPEEVKIFPNITKSASFQIKKTKKQVNVAYWLGEANPLAEVRADHAWLSLEEALRQTSGCDELAELLRSFHLAALESEPQWKLDLEALGVGAALERGKVGKWYRDEERRETLYRLLERKKKTVEFKVARPSADSACASPAVTPPSGATRGRFAENCYCPTLPRTRCQRAAKWIVGAVVAACVAAAVAALVIFRQNIFPQ
jgi:hypothetical protein